MNRLIQTIESIRIKLDGLRRHSLKETPTRTIIIDPILEALGWDIRDPNEVDLEYPTVDGKSVDYALKINNKPALLVEAKALDDPLNDVKAITQVVGYAANAGIVWCILTNGVKWKVYRSVEKCPAPEKLMFEVSLDPADSESAPVQQVAHQMWRFSRDEMAKGTLDSLGEQTFTDGKVRKALDAVMRNPNRAILNIIRKATGDEALQPQRIGESILRIWTKTSLAAQESVGAPPSLDRSPQGHAPVAGEEGPPRALRGKKRQSSHDESHHVSGKPQEVLELLRAIDRLCISLSPGAVEKYFLAKSINYIHGKHIFCCVHVLQSGLRVWLKLKYSRLENPPSIARDVTNVGHWGVGDLELGINSMAQLDEALPLIRKSFESREFR